MKNIFILLAVAVCVMSCNDPGNPPASASAIISTKDTTSYTSSVTQNTSRGQELFQQRCQVCHGMSGNNTANDAANLQTNRIDSLSIVNTIKNGKGRMPMFSGTLHDSDLAQLALYVKTLRK